MVQKAVLWIRIGFNVDPDSGNQINADPYRSGSLLDFEVTKSLIFTLKINLK
jgi:hypothetical protein